jgi:hypothetical protein
MEIDFAVGKDDRRGVDLVDLLVVEEKSRHAVALLRRSRT